MLLLVAFPLAGFSQSTLNFPRSFTPSDLALTGFAVVNPSTSSASVVFTLYSSSGAVVATSSPILIGAGGQQAKLGVPEIFPSVSQGGWVQVTSSTSGLQGFWVGGDFVKNFDGADAAQTGSDIVFPLITSNTEINIASTTAGSLTIRLFSETSQLNSVTQSIAANGVIRADASALFPGTDLTNARYVRVTGATGLMGTAVIKQFPDEIAVTNAAVAATAGADANFPQVVSQSGLWTTQIGVTNLGASSQTVTFTFTPTAGVSSPVNVTKVLGVGGALRDDIQHLFSLPTSYQEGWVRVSGTAALTGFAAYSLAPGGGVAAVPVQATPKNTLLLGHIADLGGWATGIALLNANSTAATVDIYAIDRNGSVIGNKATKTIPAGTKQSYLLRELIPQTQTRTSDGGFIYISSTQPLYGIELFFFNFNTGIVFQGNVASFPGDAYSLPGTGGGGGPVVLTSVSPTRAAIGANLTLTGTGFSTTASSNSVVFTGASGAITVTASAATATSLTVAIPNGAITGPVSVKVGSQTSGSVVLEVVATSTTLLPATTVNVVSGTTTTGADIYVPTAAGTLNLKAIGVGDPGTLIGASSSAVEVSRGQTKQLLLIGDGLNSGSTFALSGNGITINQAVVQNGNMFVTITVSATADLGPRNVSVTNSNLDVSVLSGGLFIR